MSRFNTWPCWTLLMTLCVLWGSHTANGGFERSCSRDRHMQTTKGICGNKLSTVLSTVCKMYNKRGSPSGMRPEPESSSEDAVSKLVNKDIFLPKQEALSVFKRSLRVTGTITCECCVHRCRINELRQYCSEVEPLKRGSEPEAVDVISTEEPPVTVTEDMIDNDLERDLEHAVQKRMIGQEMLRNAPSWWESINAMAYAFARAQQEKNDVRHDVQK